MEVRCGKCNKLFRVSDEKITGNGIKFSCTRCGDAVKITKEEFENYMLGQSAVSALDMFEPKAKPSAGAESGPASDLPETSEDTFASAGFGEGAGEGTGPGPEADAFGSKAAQDFFQEQDEPPSAGLSTFEKPSAMEQQQEQEPAFHSEKNLDELMDEPAASNEPAFGQEAARTEEPKPASETEPEPQTELEAALSFDMGLEQSPEQKPETDAGFEAGARRAGFDESETPASAAAPADEVAPEEDGAYEESIELPMAAEGKTTVETARPRKRSMVLVLSLVILGLVGLGGYLYLRSLLVSAEGLQLVDTAGSVQANGDLVVTGIVENTTDRERADWCIVVQVFDAKGTVLNTIRMLNGRQVYTRRDYGILAKRGENVKDLKQKAPQAHGVVLPPMGKAPFEIRYLQPPDGVAGASAELQSFNPDNLLKEIEEETK